MARTLWFGHDGVDYQPFLRKGGALQRGTDPLARSAAAAVTRQDVRGTHCAVAVLRADREGDAVRVLPCVDYVRTEGGVDVGETSCTGKQLRLEAGLVKRRQPRLPGDRMPIVHVHQHAPTGVAKEHGRICHRDGRDRLPQADLLQTAQGLVIEGDGPRQLAQAFIAFQQHNAVASEA